MALDGNAEQDWSEDSPSLARDRVPCRSLAADDLAAVARIDAKATGRDRTTYIERKIAEVLGESGIRVSMVAELDDHVVGFVMAQVDYGEFGRAEPTAVIDTLGVDPDYAHYQVGTALLSQLLANLATLRVETVRTEIGWNEYSLLAFLEQNGFRPSQRICFSRRVV